MIVKFNEGPGTYSVISSDNWKLTDNILMASALVQDAINRYHEL